MKPVDLSVVDYICKSERESEDKTIFKIKPMTGMQMYYLGVMVVEKGRAEAMKFVLTRHLVGWVNFGDAPFTDDMDHNISLLNKDVILEISDELERLSGISEEEEKN